MAQCWPEGLCQEREGCQRMSIASTDTWQPIATAPKDGRYIILAGPSGYITTSLRAEICRYDAEYRPLQPWVNHANDSFMDGGPAPTHWLPLPTMATMSHLPI